MTILKEKLSAFFNSYLFPVFIAIIVFISHTLSIEALSLVILTISVVLCAILCDDLRCIIAPVLMITFTFSYKTFLNGWLGSATFAILAICALTLIIGAVIVHMVIFKKLSALKELSHSKIIWGFLVLCVGFLLNGVFSGEYYGINITFAIILTFSFLAIYVFFYTGLKNRSDTHEYLLFILYVVSVLLVAQAIVLLLRDARLNESGSIIKETLILGWGVWNNLGGMLCMLIPVHFYYATTKKHGYIYYISALVVYLTIALTLSRSSLLFATVIFLICVVFACTRGQNVRTNRIITLALAIIAILGFIALFDKISSLLGSYISQGFGDNGRFELYKHGIENFLSHPIFGGGFGSCIEDNFGHGIEPNRYHNTIIELLATCGLMGFGAYIFHRYQTIRLIWKRKANDCVIFLGLVILGLLLTSLLDNHFFNIYPSMYYSIILCVLEKCQKEHEPLNQGIDG
ncbi:MAG: O-antigen ligase family protein [Clostridia bacterium]|nr:O-antigen ligase family protein [Clostridia bacterium]